MTFSALCGIFADMLKVEVRNNNIEKALKVLKNKVRNTKQREEISNRSEFTKDSVTKRTEKNKAIYIQKKNDEEDN